MSKECDSGSDLFGSAKPANAHQLLQYLSIWTVGRAQFSIDSARLHAIDCNSGSPQLSRESAGESVNRKFGCDIHRRTGKRCGLSEDGTDIDNSSPLVRNHSTRGVLRQRDESANVEIKMLVV